jgi:mannose-1-phosphate guanylyltransferase
MFRSDAGELESMVQRVYRQIIAADPGANITIAASKKQVSQIRNQLGDKVRVCVEPERRDTFPAICLTALYLREEQKLREDEPVVVCPVDPYVEAAYFESLKELSGLAAKGETSLFLMGIEPTYPSEKYGYILPVDPARISRVDAFREKPDMETARSYLRRGALWNGGVFAARLGYLLKCAREKIGFDDYRDFFRRYPEQQAISFDYAVAEKEPDIRVLRYAGEWKDLGTWNTFTEAMATRSLGKVFRNESCENTHVVNELNIPVLGMGCRNLVIAASNDGILIADKEQSSYIKPFVEQMEKQVRYAEKSWGSFRVLDVQEDSMTIKIVLLPGNSLHYHSHEQRDEVWTVVGGRGRAILDGKEKAVRPGDVVAMKAGCRHTLIADSELRVIEVQLGKEITVEDKVKYEMPETAG